MQALCRRRLNTGIYDEIIKVENEDAFKTGRDLAAEEAILAGISSGAALYAAIQLAKNVRKIKEKPSLCSCRITETDTIPQLCLSNKKRTASDFKIIDISEHCHPRHFLSTANGSFAY